MPIKDLRGIWKERLESEPPDVRSREVMLRLLAWRLQAEAFGGLDLPSERKLREIADALERTGTYEPKLRRDLSPGVVVTREWKGIVHRVAVTTGGFEHDGLIAHWRAKLGADEQFVEDKEHLVLTLPVRARFEAAGRASSPRQGPRRIRGFRMRR